MKNRFLLFIFAVMSLTGCSKTGPYIEIQEKLLSGKVLQVDPQGPTPGFIRRFETNEQAALVREADKYLTALKEKGEVVSAHQYTRGNFQEAGKALRVFKENKLDVFVSGQEIIFGLQPGSDIYVKKADQKRAKSLLEAR